MDTDQFDDEFASDDSISTLPLEDLEYTSDGPSCEKCGAEIAAHEALVCRQCGWYASIGSYVEIDQGWEVATDPELATDEHLQPAPDAKLPTWAWVLAGCIVGVIAESVAVRLISSGTPLQTVWSVSQLIVGFAAFAICHTVCFILVMKNEADIKLLDYILRPIKSWSVIFREMPKRGWVCYVGLSGLTAVAMSLLVIGAIPYERLLDWNVKEKAKFNLMGAIMEQAQNVAAEDEKSLEEAIGDFAGKAELEAEKQKAAKNKREKEDCIIIGYMASSTGEIQTLFLAAERYARLSYAGSVPARGIADADMEELILKLSAAKSHRPFVKVSIDGATWVKPKYLCRVSYRRKGKQGGLFGAKLEDLLGEVDLNTK
ncbi:MAG: hypothetical protein AAGD11_14450 [Planctomycetota bacterium]